MLSRALTIAASPKLKATGSEFSRRLRSDTLCSSIMLLSVTQKKPSIMPEIMLEKYSIMLTWFLLYSTCFNNNCIIKRYLGLQVRSTNTKKLMPYNLFIVLQLVSKRNILFTYTRPWISSQAFGIWNTLTHLLRFHEKWIHEIVFMVFHCFLIFLQKKGPSMPALCLMLHP